MVRRQVRVQQEPRDPDDSVHRRILADDWKVTDPGGNVLTKDQVINTAFSAERNITTARIDDIEVRDFGDWAIVTGRTQMAGTLAGEKIDVTLRFTDVFARQDGEWRCLVSQGTLLGE